MKLSQVGFFSVLLGAMVFLSSCVFAPVAPPRGILYNDQKSTLFPGRSSGPLTGESHAHSVLFLVGWGDASMKAAMNDGGIRQVAHSDYRIQNYALIYQKFTLIVYGTDEEPEAGGPPSGRP